jgi:hypothetical protein
MKSNAWWRYYGLLILSGAASLIASVIGLLMMMFGYPKSAHTTVDLMFCLLPCMSVIVYGVALAFRRTGGVLCWLLYLATLATVWWVNWQQCVQGKCNTVNPWVILFSTALSVPHLWLLFVAALSLQIAPIDYHPSSPRGHSAIE